MTPMTRENTTIVLVAHGIFKCNLINSYSIVSLLSKRFEHPPPSSNGKQPIGAKCVKKNSQITKWGLLTLFNGRDLQIKLNKDQSIFLFMIMSKGKILQ